jgi:hypothetical protein
VSASIDDVNLAVRNLVRFVLGMPDGSVRPADQIGPAGSQAEERATVKIISMDDLGVNETYDAIPNVTTAVNYDLQAPSVFVASINFYRGSTKDGGGIATYTNAAFDRASRLGRLLWATPNSEVMQTMGLGLLNVGVARNLTGVADATQENRGQVDVTFAIVNQELFQVATIASAEINVTAQMANGPEQLTIEVGP